MRFQRLSGATALFHGAQLGHYDLPDQLLGAYRAADRLLHPAAGDLPTVTRGAAHDQLVAEYLDAAGAGRPFPVADAVLAERAAVEEADARHQVRVAALERAEGHAADLLADLAEEIVVDHLRPPLAALVDQVRRHAAALPGTPTDNTVLRADEKARKAWLSMDEVATRHGTIRAARGVLSRFGYAPQADTRGQWAEVANWLELWGSEIGDPANYGKTGMAHLPGQPTDGDPRARLVWLVRGGAELWLPTVAEQDAKHEETYADRLAAMRRGASARAAVQAWGG